MTVSELVQVILSSATLLTAVGTLITALRANVRIKQTHDLVNSMSARNIALEKTESRSEGFQAGLHAREE